MRIVVLVPEPLDPPTSGGRQHARSLARLLHELGHTVTVVAPPPSAGKSSIGLELYPVHLRPAWPVYPFWRVSLAFRRRRDPFAMTTGRRWARISRRAVADLSPDAIVIVHSWAWIEFPNPTVLVLQNVESERLRREGVLSKRSLTRLRDQERTALRSVQVVVTLSEVDKRRVDRLSGVSARVVPPLVEPAASPKTSFSESLESICTVGAMDYEPNREAAIRSARLFPLLRMRAGICKLIVAGRSAKRLPRWVLETAGVDVISDVPDMSAFLTSQELLFFPAENGGGVRLKLLEAFALRLPVVTTPVGIEGIDAVAGEHLLVGATDDDLANAVLAMRTRDTRMRLADAAYLLWKDSYSQRPVLEALSSALRSLKVSNS